MKKFFSKIMSTTIFRNIVSVLLAVVMTTLFIIPSKPSFAYWIEVVTDVAIGSVIAFIIRGIVDAVHTGGKANDNKAYWIVKIIEIMYIGYWIGFSRNGIQDIISSWSFFDGIMATVNLLKLGTAIGDSYNKVASIIEELNAEEHEKSMDVAEQIENLQERIEVSTRSLEAITERIDKLLSGNDITTKL